MESEQKKILQERVAEFFESKEFDQYFYQLHQPVWVVWLVALIAPFTLIGVPIGIGAWKAIFRGNMASKKLRKRYAKLGREGSIFFSYVVIANQALKYEEGVNAPALVVGNFNNGEDDDKIMDLRETLAELSLFGDTQRKYPRTAKLLKDLEYVFKRRRRIPVEVAGDTEIYAFDLQLLGEFLPTSTLKLEAIPLVAESGRKGLSCMIPAKIVAGIFGEEADTNNSGEVDSTEWQKTSSRWQLSHAFISDSLQNDRKRFSITMISENGAEALKKVLLMLAQQTGESVDSTSLQVELIQQDLFLLALITFPNPTRDGEAYFGLVVWGPGKNWHSADFDNLPYRYFLLEYRQQALEGFQNSIVDFSHQEYLDCMTGCPLTSADFIHKVLFDILLVGKEPLKVRANPGTQALTKSMQKKKSGCGLMVKIICIVGLAFCGFIGYRAVTLYKEFESIPKVFKPGQAEFDQAERMITSHRNGTAHGNTEQAEEFAKIFSQKMKLLRGELFSKGKKRDFSLTHGEFLTYCNLVEGKCVFLVHVPQLRKFKPSAQESLCDLAWFSANSILHDAGYPQSTELAVGVKGVISYAGIYIGKLDKEGKLKSGLVVKQDGFEDRHLFHRFFDASPPEKLIEAPSDTPPD